MTTSTEHGPDQAHAQKTRLHRVLLGNTLVGCTLLVILACWLAGFLPPEPALHYLAALALLTALHAAAILTGFNLRLRDPSMTASQIVVSLLPAVYVMYFVSSPQARMAFLMIAIVAVVFGAFQFDLRRLLILVGVILSFYLALLLAMHLRTPARVDWAAESIVVMAYAMALSLMAYLCSYLGKLRRTLRQRNAELKLLMEEVQQLATHDYLTGLPNRGALMETLAREASRVQRRPPGLQTLCLCMVDVDHFKHFNDEHGHLAGDAVLRRVAMALQGTLRLGDYVGRFGGEEFLLILPDTSEAGAMRAAERVRADIAAMVVAELAPGQRVTVSCGVAINVTGEAIEQTLARADVALYRAKAAGRNQSVLAEHEATPAVGT